MMLDAKKDSIRQGGEKLTNEEIASNGLDFLFAGYDTSANTLSYTTYLLALHPTVQERLRSEIEEYFDNNPVSVANTNTYKWTCIRTHTNIITIYIAKKLAEK